MIIKLDILHYTSTGLSPDIPIARSKRCNPPGSETEFQLCYYVIFKREVEPKYLKKSNLDM